MKRVWRTLLVLAIASCLAGASVTEASAANWTFVPFTSGYTTQGAGTASWTSSTNDTGDVGLDVRAQAASLDPNSEGALVDATVGGFYQLVGDFPAGDYVAKVTFAHVFATARASGNGYSSMQFYPGVMCTGCSVTDTQWGGTTMCSCPDVVSTQPTDGPLTLPRVSDATYTYQMNVTLQQPLSLVQIGGVTDGYASSTNGGLNYGSGHAQITGSIEHVSLRPVR